MSESENDQSSNTSLICHFCLKNQSKYTCPKCYKRYCSQDCYRSQKHVGCSEAFYRKLCLDALRDVHASGDVKKKTIDILERNMHTSEDISDDADSDDCDDLLERFENMNIMKEDFDGIWKKLSQVEQRKFISLMQSGNIAHLIPAFDPWWRRPVEEITDPATFDSIKPLAALLPGKAPHSSVLYRLADVLLTYVYTLLRYNGDIAEDWEQAAVDILDLSPSFGVATKPQKETKLMHVQYREPAPVYSTLADVIGKLMLRLTQLKLACTDSVKRLLLSDLSVLIVSQTKVLRCLFEMQKVLMLAKRCRNRQLKEALQKTTFLCSCVADSEWYAREITILKDQLQKELQTAYEGPQARQEEPRAGSNWQSMIRNITISASPQIPDAEVKLIKTL